MSIRGNGIGARTERLREGYRPGAESGEPGRGNGARGYDLIIADRVRSTNSIVQKMGTERLSRLWPFFKRVNLAKDEYLCQQDERIDNIIFPETAIVSEFQILEDGRMIEVGIIGCEGAAGIAAAFSPSRAANCLQVCVAGSALVAGRDLLEREVLSDPRLQVVLHDYINTQIKHLSQRVVCNTFHSVEQRFCSWLLTLQGKSSRDRFRITHEYIARVLGVHRPSVTCIAQSLREKNLIEYGRARLAISDRAGIASLACSCGAAYQGLEGTH